MHFWFYFAEAKFWNLCTEFYYNAKQRWRSEQAIKFKAIIFLKTFETLRLSWWSKQTNETSRDVRFPDKNIQQNFRFS